MKRLLAIAAIVCSCSTALFAAPAPAPQSITLKEAVAAALSTGPGIRVAQLTLNGAKAQLSQADAKAGLSLSATTGYTHQANIGTPPTTVQTATPTSPSESVQGSVGLSGPLTSASIKAGYGVADTATATNSHPQETSLGVSLSQTVYDGYPGGRAQAAVQQAGYSYQLAQVSFETAKENVIYSVEQAYFTLLGDQQKVQLSQAQLKQSQEDLARTQAFFNANQATKLDVLTAQVTEQTAQENLVAAQNALQQDRASLAVLLGWPMDKQFTVAQVPEAAAPSITEQQAIETALSNRAEIKQYEINRANASVSLRSAESQRMPVVSLSGSASYNIFPGVTPNVDSGTWNAGINVSVPIFDSGLISAQVSQAQDTLSQLATQEAQEKQTITIAVRSALFAVKDATVRLKIAQDNVKQAQGQYELEKTKFTAGLASNLDVLNASVTLIDAQDSLQTAKTTLNLDVLNLYQAMGTLSAQQ